MAWLLIGISLLSFSFFSYTATKRSLSGLEAIFLQFFLFSVGLLGSYIFGLHASAGAEIEKIKPLAKSALRRLWSLYDSISRVAEITAGHDHDSIKTIKIQAIVREQIATADDALADWQDLVPESVEELRKKVRSSSRRNQDD